MSTAKPKGPKSILMRLLPMIRLEPQAVDLPITITPKLTFQVGGEAIEIPPEFIQVIKD